MFRTISLALMMMLGSVVAFAQMTVQGTVIDGELGEPVIGASILEIGTTNGTITDFDGCSTATRTAHARSRTSSASIWT